MFWNKKSKESGLPDLPQPSFPTIRPEIPSMRSDILRKERIPSNEEDTEDVEDNKMPERHNLPSFPDSPIRSGFSQTAIKHAIDNEDESNNEYNEETLDNNQNKKFKTIEVESGKVFPSKRLSSPPERKQTPSESFISLDSKAKEVFVKIDKFQSARKSLSSAKEKVQEIEDMLKKIRDVRMREDQELTGWERDIESVKSRIEEISKNIFEKL